MAKGERFEMVISRGLKERVKAQAEREGRSMADLVKAAMEIYLATHGEKEDD